VAVIDRNNYHRFQPLLYQVATAQLGVGDIARSLRGLFAKDHSVTVKAQVHLVDLGHVVLNGFSNRAHASASGRLEQDGVQMHLGVGVTEIGPGHVRLADGTDLKTRTVVWGGGEMAAPLLAQAVPLPRQGDHGDDRPQCRRR
jgi:NADH dehydrogenase